MPNKHFISYSSVDAKVFAFKLYDALLNSSPSIPVWLDKHDLRPGDEWDKQIVEAIRTCASLLFIMTTDSVEDQSVCKQEWTRALMYKKPIIPILLHRDAEIPFRLGTRQHIDFTDAFEPALARLRNHLQWLASPEGVLQAMKDRLADARRDLRRARDDLERARIQDEIDALEKQITDQQQVVDDPQEAERRVEASITLGLERERQPVRPVSGVKFINPPPGVAPRYFQDRFDEMRLLGEFLQDESKRMMTVVGRAGIGKTIMVCSVLKSLEGGQLPENGGPLRIDGIVYLSSSGLRRVTVPHLYADLSKLLPDTTAKQLDALYKNPQATTEAKMSALLGNFPHGCVVLLLDNFEDVIDPETLDIRDEELDEALRAVLTLPHHSVKVILTTRIAPRSLMLVQPGRQDRLELDEGLASPYAENILREMDRDGKLGLKNAAADLLDEARQCTRGYPRALEALFGILSVDRHTTLREILDDVKRDRVLPENVVKALVGEAFNRLDLVAQRVMEALAVYNHPVTPTAVNYLLQPYVSGIDSEPVLNRLMNMHFTLREGGRYYLHPVDRDYAFAHLPKGEEADRFKEDAPPYSQFALWHRGAEYFKQARKPSEDWQTLEDLAPQLAEFELRYAGQDYDTAARVLLEIDLDYLFLWGHYRMMIELHERLQGKISDPTLKQKSIGNLGTACRLMGQIQKAITCHERALVIARELEDLWGEGEWLGNLGNCYADLGKISQAIDYYEEALAIKREIGDRKGEGNQLGGLGNCYSYLGPMPKAIDYYEQALAISREIKDRRGEGNCLGNLGCCYDALGQISLAIDYYKQGMTISREIGDRRGESVDLGNISGCYLRLGQISLAINYYEQTLAIKREIGDRKGEGNQLGNLGICYSYLGQISLAIDYYEQALAISRETGERVTETHHLAHLSESYACLGQTSRAIDYIEQALAISREIGYPIMESYSLLNKGEIFLDQGEWDKAKDLCTQAIQIADEIDQAQIQNEARSRLALVHLYAGNLTAAHAAAKAARQYDLPSNNHYVLALLGVITLRQGDHSTAQQAFTEAEIQADALLAHTTQNYKALDVKGLALCGLVLCEKRNDLSAAIKTFRAARAINKDDGIVGRVLRLLDALALADPVGVETLKAVRAVAGGK